MDLARDLQTLRVPTLADLQTLYAHTLTNVQTWYVRTQNWYEHVTALICADEEELTVAQSPPWYSDTYTETGTETETDSCQ